MADFLKLTILANILKRAKLLVFYLVFGLVLIANKEVLCYIIFLLAFCLNFRFVPIFWFFFLGFGQEVFFINNLVISVFFLPVSQKIGGFILIDLSIFFYVLLGFWRFLLPRTML